MSERMTLEEMKARYAPDWVLIGEPEVDESLEVLSGIVLFHSPDRDEMYQKAIDLQLPYCAFRCFREMPEDMVFVL